MAKLTRHPRRLTGRCLANSRAIHQVVFKDGTTTRMTTTKSYDYLNRLLSISSMTGSMNVSSHAYTYNDANQRTRAQLGDGSYWIYDGWRQLAQLNATNNLLVRGFTWGLDLGGSLEKAGGIGGLLMFTDSGTSTTHFYAYDGNGNVMALVKATDGTKIADYEYGPFGEVIRILGSAARANPFQFSTKCQDEETELFYYGYRFYNAAIGRRPNRDPLGEPGFETLRRRASDGIGGEPNLYAFVGNIPISQTDSLGLTVWKCTRDTGWFWDLSAQHAYLWNDKDNTSCGRDGGIQGYGASSRLDKSPSSDECVMIPNSDGKVDAVMNCCRTPRWKLFGTGDCHEWVNICLKQMAWKTHTSTVDTGG
ncbi:MAG: RHS repeat-associated core domain-containing protein [Verrucomicrobia bacterium]|nr:RHS repeat-associated core domain-containing protein [Verrucomicrobiota bacterium]